MKNVFEISLKGEKKIFSLGNETFQMFFERSGIAGVAEFNLMLRNGHILDMLPELLYCASKVAGYPESEKDITNWLCTDVKKGLSAICIACKKMLKHLNVHEN